MTINDISKIVADDLGITQPRIRYRERLLTDTQLAAVDPERNVVYLRASAAPIDQAFAVCHELRHIWQRQNGWARSETASPAELDRDSYNRLPDELDANAYAAYMMERMYGIRPLFHGLPEDIVDEIQKSANTFTHADTATKKHQQHKNRR